MLQDAKVIDPVVAIALGLVLGATAAYSTPGLQFRNIAPIEIHYAPEEDLARIDAALLSAARIRIDMAAYVLTDREVVRALEAAAARGVEVRIVEEWSEAERSLAVAHAEVRIKAPGPLMHLKAYAIDGALVRLGSANFSYSGLTKQDNEMQIVRAPAEAQRFEQKFERLWAASAPRD